MAQEKSISDIMNSQDIFFMPDYQRGYKWSIGEVKKLLDDVSSFRPDLVPYYCLQNITLVSDDQEGNGHQYYHVVDGQQRLTTSIIILSYFKYLSQNSDGFRVTLPNLEGKIKYGVRVITDKFLRDEIVSGKIWEHADPSIFEDEIWLSRVEKQEQTRKLRHIFADKINEWEKHEHTKDRDHQDIFHLYCAAMVVGAYFSRKLPEEKETFADRYLHDVKFIENQVSGISESEIFSKINGFRVPLDGADLLRGIFITNVSREQVVEKREAEKEIYLNECRVKIGLELDAMNLWWSKPDRYQYFTYFDTIVDPDSVFDAKKYPINLLYRLYILSKKKKQILLDLFEKPEDGAIAQFEEIKHFHEIMQDWFDDKQIYHYVGYLIAQKMISFQEIFDAWREENSRRNFLKKLRKWMFDKTFQESGDEQAVDDASVPCNAYSRFWRPRIVNDKPFNWYASNEIVRRILVLLDVINYSKPSTDEDVNKPISDHMMAMFFATDHEDKEHIFPQTPIADSDLRGRGDEVRGRVRDYLMLLLKRNKKNLDETHLLDSWKKHWENGPNPVLAAEPAFPIDNITDEWFKRLVDNDNGIREYVQDRINSFVSEICEVDINSLGNIVLLNEKTNRSYGNDFYTDKRDRILSDYRNNFSIRLHTRSVFAKEFPGAQAGVPQDTFDAWSQHSIENNRNNIAAQLDNFFEEFTKNA